MGGWQNTNLRDLPGRKVRRLPDNAAHDPCLTRGRAQVTSIGIEGQCRRVGQRHVDDAAGRAFERDIVIVTGALKHTAVENCSLYARKAHAGLTVPRWGDVLGEC